MPEQRDQRTGQWVLVTRPGGEVLAAQAAGRGLSLAVFVSSRSRTQREVEGRLLDIIDGAAVAFDDVRYDHGPLTRKVREIYMDWAASCPL